MDGRPARFDDGNGSEIGVVAMSTQTESTRSAKGRTFRKRLSINLGITGLLAATAALVITFAGSGGGLTASSGSAGHPAQPVYFPSSCSTQPTTRTLTNVGLYYTPRTVTKTITKTLTHTRTIYRTRTVTVCRTVTSTAPGQTVTTTITGPGSTTTVTEQGSTVTYTTTAPGSTTTETVTETLTGSSSTSTSKSTSTSSSSSSTSTSTFTCPTADTAGFPVGQTDYTSDPIFCSYPAFPGEDPNDFFCTYSATTGVLVTDSDAGFCPADAVAN